MDPVLGGEPTGERVERPGQLDRPVAGGQHHPVDAGGVHEPTSAAGIAMPARPTGPGVWTGSAVPALNWRAQAAPSAISRAQGNRLAPT